MSPDSFFDASDYNASAKRLDDALSGDIRVTLIAGDGTVLGDNRADSESMVNHKNRKEFQMAVSTGYGEDIRLSETLGVKTIYVAMPLANGIYIRLGHPRFRKLWVCLRCACSSTAVLRGFDGAHHRLFRSVGAHAYTAV